MIFINMEYRIELNLTSKTRWINIQIAILLIKLLLLFADMEIISLYQDGRRVHKLNFIQLLASLISSIKEPK